MVNGYIRRGILMIIMIRTSGAMMFERVELFFL